MGNANPIGESDCIIRLSDGFRVVFADIANCRNLPVSSVVDVEAATGIAVGVELISPRWSLRRLGCELTLPDQVPLRVTYCCMSDCMYIYLETIEPAGQRSLRQVLPPGIAAEMLVDANDRLAGIVVRFAEQVVFRLPGEEDKTTR